MGDSPQMTFKRLEGLVGNYDYLNKDWTPLANVYIDRRTGGQTHKHDIKIGADPDNLVKKLNEDGEKRIIKRRVDSELAYKFDNNDGRSPDRPAFSNTNYFYHCSSEELITKPIKCSEPSILTDHRLVVGDADNNGQGIFLGGFKNTTTNQKKVLLGSTFANISEINFLNCSEADDCEFEKTLAFPDYLSLSANTLSLQNSLFVTDISPINKTIIPST